MIRIAWAALVVGIIASIVSNGNGTIVAVAIVGTVAFFAWALLSGRTALTCPSCGKRVKLGYSVCHHCGAQVGNPRPIGAPKHNPMEVLRECEACRSGIRPDATMCAHCRTTQSNIWVLNGGVWWDYSTGEWCWLDQGRMKWIRGEAQRL